MFAADTAAATDSCIPGLKAWPLLRIRCTLIEFPKTKCRMSILTIRHPALQSMCSKD